MVSNMINSNNIDFSEITPQIHELAQRCVSKNAIDPTLYTKYQVNRGLRDLNGKGVLTGLTEISEIQSSMEVDGQTVSCEGKLFYRGVNVEDIVAGFLKEKRFGFEETVYLLLFGDLPTKEQLDEFTQLLARYRSLPPSFVRDVILKAPSSDMMNTLARSVLTLYSYDNNANDISIDNVLRQCLQLIASFPLLSVYGYHAYNYYHNGESSLSITRCRSCPQRKIFCASCARTVAIRSWKPKFSTLPLCSMRSTAAATTPPLRRTSLFLRDGHLFHRCRFSRLAQGAEARRRKHQGCADV